MPDSVVLASGGVDSAVTLAEATEASDGVVMLHFRYGQPTELRELRCVTELAEHYGHELEVMDLGDAFAKFRGGLTDDDVDLSVHTAEDGVATSYVPMRNTVFLSLAAGLAESLGAEYGSSPSEGPVRARVPTERCVHLWFGPNVEDREGYADCRDEYAQAMEAALSLGTDRADFRVHRPVVDMGKAEIVERGEELGVPFEHTWSCYQAGEEPCGECASCEERAEGFADAGVEDPLTV